jgi:hypothetical protein
LHVASADVAVAVGNGLLTPLAAFKAYHNHLFTTQVRRILGQTVITNENAATQLSRWTEGDLDEYSALVEINEFR